MPWATLPTSVSHTHTHTQATLSPHPLLCHWDSTTYKGLRNPTACKPFNTGYDSSHDLKFLPPPPPPPASLRHPLGFLQSPGRHLSSTGHAILVPSLFSANVPSSLHTLSQQPPQPIPFPLHCDCYPHPFVVLVSLVWHPLHLLLSFPPYVAASTSLFCGLIPPSFCLAPLPRQFHFLPPPSLSLSQTCSFLHV